MSKSFALPRKQNRKMARRLGQAYREGKEETMAGEVKE
jgi:hypothetical protein